MNVPRSALTGGALLALLTMLVYWPALQGGFVWDDDSMLTANAVVQSPNGLKDIWWSTKLTDYYPLTWTSLWVEWWLWGMNATGYHLTNLVLHILSTILWWRILKRLPIPGAWLAALMFAVHPVNVESVAWIAERKNTLALFFYTLALWGYLRFEEQVDSISGMGGWGWYGMSVLAYLLSLWSKTSGVMMPAVLLLYAWWRRGRIERRDLHRSAPFFGLALVLGLVTVWFQYYSAQAAGDVATRSLGARLAGAGMAVWFYLWKAIWPTRLAFVYPRWEINASFPLVYLPVVALVLCFAVFWLWRGGWGRPLLFGLGYFVVGLLPVLGFLKIYFQRYSLVADHWQYFSIMGVIALGVGGGVRFFTTKGRCRIAGWGLGTLMVGALCLLTWRQCGVYRNDETLWRDTLAKNPGSWLAHNNLGIELWDQGRIPEAIAQYKQAIQLDPTFAETYNNLGVALKQTGRIQEAIAQYEQALQLNPDFFEAHCNLGGILMQLGRIPEAVEHYKEAVRLQFDSAEAHYNLAVALKQQGWTKDAIGHYEQALRYKPDLAEAHHNLALALWQEGQMSEAIAHWEQALRIKPDYPEAQNGLAWLLATLGPAEGGDLVRAVALAEQACDLTGYQASGDVDTLAVAYAAAGRFHDAIVTAEKAIALARAAGQPQLAEEIEARLELYRGGHAYHPPSAAPGQGNGGPSKEIFKNSKP